jgi:hypothetical protein
MVGLALRIVVPADPGWVATVILLGIFLSKSSLEIRIGPA